MNIHHTSSSKYKNANYIFILAQSEEDFEKFYKMLGDPVKLKGWDRFRAGLDTKSKY
jgi:hypothetical protein